jgi:hypothetical protein
VVAVIVLTLPATAQTVFVNLRDSNVYVARQTTQNYSSRTGPDLTGVIPEAIIYSGWKKLEPGESLSVPPGKYFLRSGGTPLSWPNLARSRGYVRKQEFNESIPPRGDARAAAEKKLASRGFERVDFLDFKASVYRTGDDYRIVEKKFPVDFSSRSVQFLNERFHVPGRVAWHTRNIETRWTRDISFTEQSNYVWLGGSLEGKQVRPFGPREPAYVRGSITVHYTERVR